MPVNINDGALEWDALIDGSQFQAQINRIEQQLKNFTNNVQQNTNQVDEFFKRAATAAAGFFSLQAGENFVRQLISVRGEFQDIQSAFETMLGSKEKADKLMAEATRLAANTPFSLTEVAAGSKQLLAYGFSAESLTQNLTNLGNIAAGLKVPLGDLIYLYGTLKASGRVTQMDINQFAGRGIPIYEALATVLKKNTDQIRGLVSAGQIGFPEIEKAFQSMTGEGGKFFNLMEKQSQNLNGRISNLGDAFDQMLNKIGAQNQGILNSGIVELTSLVNNYQKVLDIIEELIVVYGVYRAALIATAVAERVVAEGQLQAALAGQAMAKSAIIYNGALSILNQGLTAVSAGIQRFLDVTKLSNPYVALAAALAAGAVLTYKAFTQEVNYSAKASSSYTSELIKEKQKLDDVFEKLKETKAGTTERKDAVKLLTEQYGQYLPKMDIEKASIKDLNDLYSTLNQKLDQNVRLRVKQQQTNAIEEDVANSQNAQLERITEALSDDKLGAKNVNQVLANLIQNANNGKIRLGPGNIGSSDDVANARKFVLQILGVKDLSKVSSATEMIITDALNQIQVASDRELKAKKSLNAILGGVAAQAADDGTKPSEPPKPIHDAAYYEKIKTDATNQLKSLDKLDSQFTQKRDALRKTINDAQRELDAFNVESYDKQQNARKELLAKQSEFYDKVAKLNEEALEAQKTQDQREIDQVKFKYAELKKEAVKVKIDPNTVKLNGVAGIDNAEKVEEDQVRAKQSVRDYKESLDAQKQLFEQYEQTKNDFGEKAANERYGKDLQGFKTFLSYLQAERDKLNGATGAEASGKLDLLGKLIPPEKIAKTKKDFDDLQKLIQSTITFEERAEQISQQYADKAKKLREAGKNDEADRIEKQGEAELDQLVLNNQAKIDSYKDLNDQIANLTVAQATLRIKQARATADAEFAAGQITEQAYKRIITIIDAAEKKIAGNTFVQGLSALSSVFSTLAQDTQGFNSGLSSVFNTLSRITATAASLKDNIGKFSDQIKNYQKNKQENGGGLLGAVSSITSMIPVAGAIISGVITVVSGVVNFFKQAKQTAIQSAAELQKYQDSLVVSEIKYNELLRDQLRTQGDISKMTASELKMRQQMLGLQKSQAQSDYNALLARIQSSGQQITGEHTEKYGGFLGIGKKTKVVQDLAGLSDADYDTLLKLYTEGKLTDQTKSWFEELKNVHDELDSIGQSTQEAADQFNKIVTGTTADSIAQAIIDGFKSGKRTAADFADDFQQLMQDAALSAFEANYLNAKIDDFYKQFAAASADGLTQDKIDQLRAAYSKVINDASGQLGDLEKVLGTSVSSSTSSSNSLAGAIKGMTSDQADLLAGQFGGMRQAQLQQVNISQQQLAVMMQSSQASAQRHVEIITQGERKIKLLEGIKTNTDNLGDMKVSLQNIEKKIGSANDSLLANGKV